jgi:hypothetical protein
MSNPTAAADFRQQEYAMRQKLENYQKNQQNRANAA